MTRRQAGEESKLYYPGTVDDTAVVSSDGTAFGLRRLRPRGLRLKTTAESLEHFSHRRQSRIIAALLQMVGNWRAALQGGHCMAG